MQSLSKTSKISLSFFFLYVFVIPFCYFRHDDWLIIGTAVKHMPKDWGLLWRATLFYSPYRQEIWFFRPVFKILTFVNFKLFAFHHGMWVIEQIFLLLATLILSSRALFRIRNRNSDVEVFLVTFIFCIPLHFGSLVWIGEGMMNIPQVLFLSIALYGYLKNEVPTPFSIVLSLLGYIGALLCKESSVVFPGLLLLLTFYFRDFKRDFKQLFLHAFVTLAYLIARFKYFDVNPGYHPAFDFVHFVRPLLIFAAVIFLGPLLFVLTTFYRKKDKGFSLLNLQRAILFSGFVLLLVLPHLGHWFFSPGWFFLPGFWAAWIFPLVFEDTTLFKSKIRTTAFLLLIASTIPLVWQLKNLGWQHWGKVQRNLHEIIRNTDPTGIKRMFIQECVNEEYPTSDLARVAGSTDSIEHIWNLSHDQKIHVIEIECKATVPVDPESKVIHFKFPDLTMQ